MLLHVVEVVETVGGSIACRGRDEGSTHERVGERAKRVARNEWKAASRLHAGAGTPEKSTRICTWGTGRLS